MGLVRASLTIWTVTTGRPSDAVLSDDEPLEHALNANAATSALASTGATGECFIIVDNPSLDYRSLAVKLCSYALSESRSTMTSSF